MSSHKGYPKKPRRATNVVAKRMIQKDFWLSQRHSRLALIRRLLPAMASADRATASTSGLRLPR